MKQCCTRRLAFLLAWLLVLRVVLLVLLLGDMADFRGRSLSFMVESSQPTIPWVIGLITVAAGISCSLMQPAIVAGVDAATGPRPAVDLG